LSESEGDSSDSDKSFQLIRKKKSSSKALKVQFVSESDKPDKKKQANETTAEEKDFLKQITHLESTDESLEKSGSSDDMP
jgi:surfactin synthase thioesterase subunit